MKVRELIAQLSDDIDPEAEVLVEVSGDGGPVNSIESGRQMILLFGNRRNEWEPFVRLVSR